MKTSAEMFSQCPTGEGAVLLSTSSIALAADFRAASGIDSRAPHFDSVIFTPSAEKTEHPMWSPRSGEFMRSSNDLRSFYMMVQDIPGQTASVTIKGGDMPYMRQLQTMRGFAPYRRAKGGQIPGGCIVGAARTEYEAGLYLHERSMEHFGELASTAYPLRLNEVTKVPSSTGELVGIRDYANSEAYTGNIGPRNRKELGLQNGEGLGDMLFDRFSLVPCEYIYALPEPSNVRVNDLYSYLLFGKLDETPDTYDVDAYNASTKDPLFHMNTDIDRMGDNFPAAKGRKDRVIRNIYRLLAATYGFSADSVLPDYDITDENYQSSLAQISEKCQKTGVDSLVLERFIGNMTKTAALAHSDGRVFCRGEVVGGSFMPRNVTIGGSVLDLDTLGKLNPDAHWQRLPRDIMEMTLSITSIERLVRRTNAPQLFGYVLNKYVDHLETLGVSRKKRVETKEYLRGNTAVIDAATCLQNHELDIFKNH